MNSQFHSIIQHFLKKAFWAIIFVSLVISCKKGEEPDPSDPNPPVEEGVFTTGPEQTYKVAGTGVVEVKDTLTGATFRFPKGGTGTLSIARVLASKEYTLPPAGSGLKAFSINYSGSEDEPIEILLSNNGKDIPNIWALQYPTGCVDEADPNKPAWIPLLSVDPTKNPAVYRMSFNPKVITKNGRIAGTWVIPIILLGPITIVGKDYLEVQSFSSQTSTSLQNLVNYIPLPQRDSIVKRINNSYKLKIYGGGLIVGMGSVTHYHPFEKDGTRNPYITYVTTGFWGGEVATDRTVYHETGHYLSHVIGGDAFMKKMDAQAKALDKNRHAVGMERPERDMVEEYAYWSEATLNGFQFGDRPNIFSTSVAGTLANPPSLEDVDFPKREGYGAVLMAYLTHKGSNITFTLSEGSQDSPSIGLSVPEVWGILTQSTAVPSAPATKDELYTAIQTYLKKNQPSKADFLPVIAQRTGWRYKVKARLVTESGTGTNKIQTPIPYARVLGVFKSSSTGAKEYFSQKDSVKTDLNGNLEITKIFPEKSYLRVVFEKDKIKYVKDIEINVPISQLTNQVLDLKDIVVPLNDVLSGVSITIAGGFSTSEGNTLMSLPVSINSELQDNAGVVSGTSPSETLELKYNPATFALTSFSYKKTPTSTNGYETSIKGGGIPATAFKLDTKENSYSYQWFISGTETKNYLQEVTSYNATNGFRIYGVLPYKDGTLRISLSFIKN